MGSKGKVYLLGAGPGDPELITERALRRLAEADLVLYDALVHPALLEKAPRAERVFVGKRAGRPSERQGAIDARMITAAREGKVVVRLKGGDPFLFGRGSEEAERLVEAGVPFEIVPGVPSPVAATAYAGLTLTHRALSSSVAYLTATESVEKDRSSHDWAKLATGPETLVIFMGMRKIGSLMSLLIEHGRRPDTPAAVVQWASLPRQRTVVGTVGDIAERARAAGLGLPALTIVGDVVAMRETLRWYEDKPLFGKRVLVTRPAHQTEDIERWLRDEAAEPVVVPAITIGPPSDAAPLEEAVADLGAYRWVVLTSANGVRALFDAIAAAGGDARWLGRARVAAIGPATAAALLAEGIRADVVPEEFRGEEVAEAILGADPDASGSRALLPRAEVAREALPDRLREAGVEVNVVAAYRTGGASEEDVDRLRDLLLHRPRVDVVTFTSPSTVARVADALGDAATLALSQVSLACIGPITAKAVRERGLDVAVEAEDYTARGLVDALVAWAQSEITT